VFFVGSQSILVTLLETNLYSRVWLGWKSTVKRILPVFIESSLSEDLHPVKTQIITTVEVINAAFNFIPFRGLIGDW